MFSLKLVAATLPFLLAAAAPSPEEDWKIFLGWDGKDVSVEQIQSNAHLVCALPTRYPSQNSHPIAIHRTLARLPRPTACTFAPMPTSRATVFVSFASTNGYCLTIPAQVHVTGFSSGQCVGVGSDFNDKVSSFGPDKGVTCNIYSDAGCKGRLTGDVINPGMTLRRSVCSFL